MRVGRWISSCEEIGAEARDGGGLVGLRDPYVGSVCRGLVK